MDRARRMSAVVGTVAVMLLTAARPGQAVEIAPRDGGWQVTGARYVAVIDERGHFRTLEVDGVAFLGEQDYQGQRRIGGHFPGDEPADRVTREGSTIHAQRGDVRVSYTFDDAGFTLATEGGQVQWFLTENVHALVATHTVVPRNAVTGDVRLIVADRGAAIAVSQPHHNTRGRLSPSFLTRGGKKSDAFECRFDCGVAFEPFELVTPTEFGPTGRDPGVTAEYARGETPSVSLTLRSFAAAEVAMAVRFTAVNHPRGGETVFEARRPVTIAPDEPTTLTIDVPVEAPGLYWVTAELLAGDESTFSRQYAFIYRRDDFKPPLTRPADFAEFWQSKLEAMRSIPFEAELTPNEAMSDERFMHYDLTLNDFDGQRLATFLRVPRGEGPFHAEVLQHRAPDNEGIGRILKKLESQEPGVGRGQRGGDRIRVGMPQPGEARYTGWNGRDDNNMLHTYLRLVRLMDYLRSRDDVDHLFIFGASRGGACALAAAALSPERVAAVNAHVPTSCGLSWADRPYRGWGKPPAPTPEGLAVAAYFDPVNFAPDLVVPVVLDAGIYDGLSPAPGILAFHNHAINAPFRRCAIEQGHHGYFKPHNRRQMEADLAEYLKQTRGIGHQRRGREH